LTDEILSEREIEYFISDWKLTPDSGGKFEVIVDGELIYSKKALKRHANPGEIRSLLLQELDKIRPAGFQVPDDD